MPFRSQEDKTSGDKSLKGRLMHNMTVLDERMAVKYLNVMKISHMIWMAITCTVKS